MDILKGRASYNCNKVRGRTFSQSSNVSRDTSMSSTKSSVVYHERMEKNNDMDINKNVSPGLSYETPQEQTIHLSMAAQNQANMLSMQNNLTHNNSSQHVPGEYPTSISPQGSTTQNVESTFINIPLPYNLNAPMDPEIWDSNFHPISLYDSIEHIGSNAKNIKNILKFIVKYISNKQINPNEANKLDNFNGIGEAVWNFISSIYKAN